MNRGQLIQRLAANAGVTRVEATRMLDAVLDVVREGLDEDGSVALSGFGTFTTRQRKARMGRHPSTGKPVQVPAGTRVGFRASRKLHESLAANQSPPVEIDVSSNGRHDPG